MNTTLRKAIMKRTQLQNHYYKSKNSEDFRTFKKQRNFVSRLYKKQRRTFYNNMDLKTFTDNKKFWKNVNPLFSGKSKTHKKISLVEQNKIITDDRELAQTFNDFFKNAVTNLNLEKNTGYEENTNGITDPVEVAVLKLNNHHSINRINEIVVEIHTEQEFKFEHTHVADIEKEMRNLNVKKATTFTNIPVKILKNNSEICSPFLNSILNASFDNGAFPNTLKISDVLSIFKSTDSTLMTNYRPVSVLPSPSKIFERVMQGQIVGYIDKYISKYLCGYRKGYSTQHALILLLEKWKYALDIQGQY